MKNHTKKSHEKRKVPNFKVRTVWIAGWLITATALLILFWPDTDGTLLSSPTPTPSQPTAPSSTTDNAGQDRLPGRWVRSDGGYVIEIRKASSEGKLDAAYFNPNPIQVGSAEWQHKEGKLVVVVELRDTNYPGSLYTLEFLAANDRLVGTYYQAVERVTYPVEFSREN